MRKILWTLAVAALVQLPSRMPAADGTVKVAFYNIRSGQGTEPLRGRAAPFAVGSNCTDPSKRVNAWGSGMVQQTLTSALGSDPSVVALGLAEAWKAVCASPERVRTALGWKAASTTHNGVAVVAKYGIKDERWQQLDTSRNKNPADTAWVLRASVCTASDCRRTLAVYVAHWYATGPEREAGYERQAQQTVAFMRETSGGPHVLIGDLNVWTAPGRVCRQTPNGAAAVGVLTAAGYIDAWPRIHGDAEGFTGMLNRAKCGTPEGYAWKRIDYAWSPSTYPPRDITRFGVVPAGEAAPSDHYGIVATYPQ
jgi:exonuclease III